MSRLLTIPLLLILASPEAFPEEPAAKGQCYAFLVSSWSGTKIHARRHHDWLLRFHTYLTKTAGVPAENIIALCGDEDLLHPAVKGHATAESIRKSLEELAGKATAADQFVLFMVGHGVVTDKIPTLVLSGPDFSAADLAESLEGIQAANQVVLNFSASSGSFLSFLAQKGRANIAATSPGEGNEPVLAEFFLRAIESKRADGEGAPAAGRKDGVVTALEAYNWATHETALWIMRIRAAGDGWRLSGKESVEIFEKLYVGPDDAPGARKLARGSDRNVPDPIVVIKPQDGLVDSSWRGRRVLSEHSTLEDCGEETGVSAIRSEGYEPLAGKKVGDPGYLAGRVVIGKAELLKP